MEYLIKCQFLKGLWTNRSLETGEFSARSQRWGGLDGRFRTRVNRKYVFSHKVFIKRFDYKLPAMDYGKCMCVYIRVFIYIYIDSNIYRNYISSLFFSLSGSGILGALYTGSAVDVNAPSWRLYGEFNPFLCMGQLQNTFYSVDIHYFRSVL